MSLIRDIAYVRVAADDLDAQEQFLTDFGMRRVERSDSALYMRGAGRQPVIHITERSAGFVPGIGLIAASNEAVESIAAMAGSQVSRNEEPGGGVVTRLVDPSGYRVDVVHRPEVEPLPARALIEANVGADRSKFRRHNTKVRLDMAPSTVLRLGHVVMKVPNAVASFAWYQRHFGMKITDSVYVGTPDNLMMAFAHWGLGQTYTDHHSLAFLQVPVPGFDHSAFEVIDIDDVMCGNAYLAKAAHTHSFGVGRHIGGSMVFDYWRDAGGNKIEHWADGDHVNDDYQTTNLPITQVTIATWGPEVSPEFYK